MAADGEKRPGVRGDGKTEPQAAANGEMAGGSSAWRRIGAFFLSPRNLYILGFLVVLALTFAEVSRGRHRNFMIFAESTRLFWQQIPPYGANWPPAGMELDYFLYGPLFNVLFAPFAFLPAWLGPFVWNLFNFTAWFAAIFTLPERFTREEKCKTFLYTFLILACTLLSFQYNPLVGSIFLFAYSLLERDKGFWAVLLILLSGFTKIYGIFQLGLLVCYPRFWRNAAYAAAIGAVLLVVPAIGTTWEGLPGWYGEWVGALTSHKDTRTWMTVFYLRPFNLLRIQTWVQAGVLAALGAGLLLDRRRWRNEFFRIGCLAALMGYVIFFSNSSERHTYCIALAGYMLWYWTMRRAGALTAFDRTMFWAVFAVLVVMPVDVLCPPSVMEFFFGWQLNLWLFLVLWLRIVWTTLVRMPQQLRSEPQAGL